MQEIYRFIDGVSPLSVWLNPFSNITLLGKLKINLLFFDKSYNE